MLIIVCKTVFVAIKIMFEGDQSFFSNETLLDFMQTVIIGVTILIVAIPEGLPLAVSIAMALSINRLKAEEILIKNLEGVQNCAMLHDICVGKTGTITRGHMNVIGYHICEQDVAEIYSRETAPNNFNEKLEVGSELKQLIKQCIVNNSDVRIEANDTTLTFEPQGKGLDVGMCNFLVDNDEDIMALFTQRNREAKAQYVGNFVQEDQMTIVVRAIPGDDANVGVYVKGAPEKVIELCSSTYDFSFQPKDLDEGEKSRITDDVVSNQMAQQGLKVLSYAYKAMDKETWLSLIEGGDLESPELRAELEQELIYLATFGLEDPVRDGVLEAVQWIKYGR